MNSKPDENSKLPKHVNNNYLYTSYRTRPSIREAWNRAEPDFLKYNISMKIKA
jgi:hypothetical protein